MCWLSRCCPTHWTSIYGTADAAIPNERSHLEGADNIAYRLAFNTLRNTYEQIREALVIALADELRAIESYARLIDAIAQRRGEAAAEEAGKIVALGSEGVMTALELLDQLETGERT